jgi:hypothetical protein
MHQRLPFSASFRKRFPWGVSETVEYPLWRIRSFAGLFFELGNEFGNGTLGYVKLPHPIAEQHGWGFCVPGSLALPGHPEMYLVDTLHSAFAARRGETLTWPLFV